MLSHQELLNVFNMKYGGKENLGWGPPLRLKFKYFTPDDWYEALVNKHVTPEVRWLDVGAGRSLLPNNPILAKTLSQRCKLLVGCDPDDTILENPYLHEKVKAQINDCSFKTQFDLVTMRMVAEHIADPQDALKSLFSITSQEGKVVVYTIFRWSPIAIFTFLTPFNLHYKVKKFLWHTTEEKDTFPVVYKMNTRKALRSLFEAHGFKELSFSYLDDCRTFSRFKIGALSELTLNKALRLANLHYPEVCILGVYQKLAS